MDGVTIDMDTAELFAALDKLGARGQQLVFTAAGETAAAIVREAQGRLARQLGIGATGQTVAGITAHPDEAGTGYLVQASRDQFPNLPLWLEKGTKRGLGHHANLARPFWYISAELEEGPHLRRIEDALTAAIEETGLGD